MPRPLSIATLVLAPMKKRLTTILVLSSLLLTSCHPGVKVEIINNTGQDIAIVSINPNLKEHLYRARNGQTVAIEVPLKVRIEYKAGSWNYVLKPVGEPFRKKVGI